MNSNQFQRGDHLVSPRLGYSHHGLYLGNDQVIHYTGFSNGQHEGQIAITSLTEFCSGRSCEVQAHRRRTYSIEESLDRACSRLGEDWYDVLRNNCEHFVNWCIQGLHASQQVNRLIAAAALTRKLLLASEAGVLAHLARRAISAAIATSCVQSTGAITGVMIGTAAIPTAPVLTSIGLGLSVGYGIKQLVAWIRR